MTGDLPRGGADDAPIRAFLIADVRGYTLFTQERGDEAGAKLAAKFADIVRDVVETRGGTLLELRGDEALCVFGSAREAIRTAVELQERFVEETIASPELPLTVGIGLDAGEAVPVEGGYRGGALNLAARLCGQARAGEILASREATHLARRLDGIRYQDRGSLTFKGLSDPVTVVRVVPETGDPIERLRPFAPPAPEPPPTQRRWLVPVAVAAALALVAVAIPLLGGDEDPGHIGSDSVALLDIEDGSVGLSETIGDRPGAMAVAFDSVWVLQPDRGRIVRLDTDDGAVQDTIPVGSSPASLVAGDDEIWVTNAVDGTVSRVDEETNQASQSLPAGSRPTGIASGDGALWIADTTGAALLRVDPSGVDEPSSIPLPGEPAGVEWTDHGVWVSYSPDGIARIDPSSGMITHTQTVGAEPTAILLAHGSIWVANHLGGTVARIDPSSGDVVDLIPVGDGPNALASTTDSVWVTNEYDGTVMMIDPTTNDVARAVSLDATAASLATDGDGLWVAVGASASEHRGGTLRVAGGVIESLDPAVAYDTQAWQILTITNDGLLSYKRVGGTEGTTLVPDLASALPDVSPDGLTYRFPLRDGLRYSTGEPVLPEDFRYGLERAIAITPDAANFFGAIEGAAACAEAGQACDLSNGILVDGAAISIRLERPDPDFLYKLAMPFAYPLPSIVPMEDQRLEPLPATGPYMVRDGSREGIELGRNPEFQQWSGAAQPDGFVDAITWEFREGRIDALQAGALDWTIGAPPEDVDALRASSPDQVVSAPDSSIFFVGFDVAQAPFDDVRVRRAVNYAIDRAHVVELLGGPAFFRPSCQLVPPSIPGYQPFCPYTADPDTGRWSAPDLERARQLIQAAGVAGDHVTVWSPSGAGVPTGIDEVMAYVADLLTQLGLPAELRVIDNVDTYFGKYLYGTEPGTARHPAIFMAGWLPDFLTATNYIEPQFGCNAGPNAFGVCDRTLERMMDEAKRLQLLDLGAANRAWAEADRRLVEEAMLAPLTNGLVAYPVSDRVGNVQIHPLWTLLLSRLWVR
ncbi:MAG TPA: ABC transporter substrate-binding protein [Actinomycetota bacterium]|jgi:peptide/nickel transport system substrate-binding protein|nr:ABC transporter substrate-binding protein [Actinomycetota bacterium]